MYTVDTTLDALKKYDIREADLSVWEKEIGLDIPVDAHGRKQYTPHHINLFKNIKKHIALGRTLSEIRQIITLPPAAEARPERIVPQVKEATRPSTAKSVNVPANASADAPTSTPVQASVVKKNPYASVPEKPVVRSGKPTVKTTSGAANVVNLVQSLTREKDQLYKKLLETEKLNSHLYSANSLYHKKVKDLSQHIDQLRTSLQENENFKLLDDKAKLHKQLLAFEKSTQFKNEEVQKQKHENELLRSQVEQLESRIHALTFGFNAQRFCGDWMETGHLVEVVYDNFGINIEPERVRLFRISEEPARLYGNTAVINTSYQYETNALWRRNESLTVSCVDDNTLEGELIAEYILDGVPVAKALYRISCRRQ